MQGAQIFTEVNYTKQRHFDTTLSRNNSKVECKNYSQL